MVQTLSKRLQLSDLSKKIELPAGTYKIKFVNPDQKIDQEQSVTLGAGEVKKVMRKS
jgi:hypothetical protein